MQDPTPPIPREAAADSRSSELPAVEVIAPREHMGAVTVLNSCDVVMPVKRMKSRITDS